MAPIFSLLAVAATFAATQPQKSCDSLAAVSLPNATISQAVLVPAGSFTPPGDTRPTEGLPEFCRITGTIKPTADSDIRFEVWLPSKTWNGKYLGAGNGGYAGTINYGAGGLAAAIRRGYASASTDTGHVTKPGVDATWALGHPEKVIDWGYRAIHELTVRAKTLLAAYYGQPASKSYFSSCSNGGRQALMEAQRFPEDFDGIIAGAPANHFTHHMVQFMWNSQALAAGYIPPSKLPAIEAAMLKACDAADTLRDGLIEDSSKCHFDPKSMVCTGAESDSCLTSAQAAALNKIYAGPRDSKNRLLMAGFERGAETGPGGWQGWITGAEMGKSAQHAFGSQFFQNMVYEKPDWDFKTFKVDADTAAADRKLAKHIDAIDPDLRPFARRGGKLILFHGWNDAALPAQNTIQYFNKVRAKVGANKADAFLRLYMLPGVQHCGGGPGPNSFGYFAADPDPTRDLLNALDKWVEAGQAPNRVIAAKYKNNRPSDGVERTRPLCAYPEVARYKGSGPEDDAVNFECRKP